MRNPIHAAATAGGLMLMIWAFTTADHATSGPGPRPASPAPVTTIWLAPRAVVEQQSLPPYWHLNPPSWCAEDMLCWIGTKADGRPDAESLTDWRFQLRHAHVFENRHRVGPGLADSLAESGYPRATTRDWERCTVWLNYDGHHLFCPDGFHAVW